MGDILDSLAQVLASLDEVTDAPLLERLANGERIQRQAIAWLRQHGSALLARQEGEDAANYRWLRENLLWSKSYDGYVRWTVEINMPEPGIHEGHPPVAETLDAAIQAARSGGGG